MLRSDYLSLLFFLVFVIPPFIDDLPIINVQELFCSIREDEKMCMYTSITKWKIYGTKDL